MLPCCMTSKFAKTSVHLSSFTLSPITQDAISKEVATSTSIYKVALQSYSADSYSYETGGAVSYTLNLPLVDYKKPQFS